MTTQNSLPRRRHEYLLRELDLHGSVRAASAAEVLGVSEVTVRRDIVALETAGRLTRVHGGAISAVVPASPQSARTNIGVVVPSSISHFPAIVRGMQAASYSLKARLVLAVSHYRAELEQRQVERMVELGVEGIVLTPTLRDRSEEELSAWLSSVPVPVVLLERRLDSSALAGYDSARTDHARGAILAVEHLARLGHRSVALGLFDRTPTAPLIREGHERASRRLSLTPAPDISLPKGEGDPDAMDRACDLLLDECVRTGVGAVIVHTDIHAARLVELATDRGMSIPDDLAVVAFDDDTAGLAMVPLTAVTAPLPDLGRQALRLVNERVAERSGERAAPRHLEVLPTLTVRSSCGASAASAAAAAAR